MARSMSNRGLRVLLILTGLVVLAVVVQSFRFGMSIGRERDAFAEIARDLQVVDLALADVRAAQAGYVATGQGPAFWMKRSRDLVTNIEATLERLRASTSSADARAHYDAATAFLGNLAAADKRARDYVGGDQRFLASDAIFMDGLDTSRSLGAEIAAAAQAERAQTDAFTARTARFRFITIVATLVWGMFFVFVIYARLGRSPEAPAEARAPADAEPAAATAAVVPVSADATAMSLPAIADLCGDLARVLDGRDVPALLERTVKVLGAKGAVLWVIDTSGTFLRPLLLHGYPEKVVRRLGQLQVDADNMTSLAFRSLKAQSVNGSGPDKSGAIAVPLVTGTGCVGVLAAELHRPRTDNDTLSAAKMIAAQLAALATPVAQDSSGKAVG